MQIALPVENPAQSQHSRPTLYDEAAMEAFRRRHRIDPQRVRKMRYTAFQMHSRSIRRFSDWVSMEPKLRRKNSISSHQDPPAT